MVILRGTIEADLDSVVALEAAPDTSHWLAETGRDWHARTLVDPDQKHLVAIVDGAIAGFVVLAGLGDPRRVVELRRIVVGTEHRGAGVGRELMRLALAHASETVGARGVWLDVKSTNHRAISLYRSEGFAVEPTSPGAGQPDLIVMTRSIQR